MNFHIISDIHLEFRYYSLKSHVNKQNRKGIPENEEINLILAGDVGYPELPSFSQFIESVSVLYDHVFFVPGNHEYYKKYISTTKELIKKTFSGYPNVYLLDNDMILHGFNGNHLYIIGSTLWTYVSEDDPTRKHPINDCYQIKDFTIEMSNQFHTEGKKFLKTAISQAQSEDKKCIVITHHIPSHSVIDPVYKGGEINSFFASDCDELISSPVILWAYGHTHLKANHRIHDVEMICNPKGYPSEYSRYSTTCIFKV